MSHTLDDLLKSIDEVAPNNEQSQQNIQSKPTSQTQQKPVSQNIQSQTPQNQKTKKWSKMSMKWFFIWCLVFFLFFVWLIYLWFNIAISNPDTLKQMWMDNNTAKKLLMFFSVLFFAPLFLVSFFMFIINIYRLITVKAWKWKYVFGLIVWIIFLLSSIIWWTLALDKIDKIASLTARSNSLITSYVITDDKEDKWTVYDGKFPIIAPIDVKFQLNDDYLRTNTLKKLKLDPQTIKWYELDCWNWQKLKMNKDFYFQKHCLFIDKWKYPVKVNIIYWDKSQQEVEVGDFEVKSKLIIKTDWGNDIGVNKLNDEKTEIEAWVIPAKIQFDATQLFWDLWLSEYDIKWYINWSLQNVESNKVVYDYIFDKENLHTISYSLPALWSNKFIMKLRIKPSVFSECKINVSNISLDKYKVQVSWINIKLLENYYYEIQNIDTLDNSRLDYQKLWFTHKIPEWWSYKIVMKYTTKKLEIWECSSDTIEWARSSYKIFHILKWRLNEDEKFVALKENIKKTTEEDPNISDNNWDLENNDGEISSDKLDENSDLENNNTAYYLIEKIPYEIELKIDKIVPEDDNAIIKVYLDNKEQDNLWNRTYNIELTEEKTYIFRIEVKNQKWWTANKYINIDVKKKPIIAKLKITPSVWMEPLDVELDASLSEIIWNDEIVFFTWDFGDWEKMSNSSQWKIRHTYKFDKERDSWEFHPKVFIKTKNWYDDTIEWSVMIKREAKEVRIMVEPPYSNQVSKIMSNIQFSIETQWDVKSIEWDFGNWKKISWEWREYIQATTTYDEPWMYEVKTTVYYNDSPNITEKIKMKIVE
jgi:hypothetical protein